MLLNFGSMTRGAVERICMSFSIVVHYTHCIAMSVSMQALASGHGNTITTLIRGDGMLAIVANIGTSTLATQTRCKLATIYMYDLRMKKERSRERIRIGNFPCLIFLVLDWDTRTLGGIFHNRIAKPSVCKCFVSP